MESGACHSPLRIVWLGRMDYRPAMALQEELRTKILQGDEGAEALLLLEHPPVITLGRSARLDDVRWAPAERIAAGVALERSNRGGQVTYHGPGQLIAYPVVRLRRGVLAHVEALAAAAVDVAAQYGVAARFRRDCPGVWVDDRKLGSIGLHVHRRVAVSGLALQVAADVAAFEHIVACGQPSTKPTSLSVEAKCALSPPELAPSLGEALCARLERTPQLDSSIRPLLSRSTAVE